METKTKVIFVLGSFILGFAFGRWAAPDHVKIETRTVEVEKKTTDTDTNRDKHLKTVVVEITKPDGTKEKTSTTTVDTNTERKTHSTDDLAKDTQTLKETDKGAKVTIAALAGAPVSFGGQVTPVWGGIVAKPILGPVTVGVWGLSNSTAGVALGLTF